MDSADPAFPLLAAGFLAAAIRIALPLLLASLGETFSERGGVINLGLEGAMLVGALSAALAAKSGGLAVGVMASLVAGVLMASLMAALAVWLKTDQIIAGTAITLGSLGITGAVYRQVYGASGAGLTLPTLGPVDVPLLHRIPIAGPAFFHQPILVYAGYLLIPLSWFILFRTRWGLGLRAAGESPAAALAAGIRVRWVKTGGVLLSGALGGLAGGSLVLGQVGTFAERMTAGRGFVAIAIVVLGRWHPFGVALAAILFGVLSALQVLFQAMGVDVPYQVFLMLPYLLTLLALAGAGGRTSPAALGQSSI
jgi:general nucleoside transport system permease protein